MENKSRVSLRIEYFLIDWEPAKAEDIIDALPEEALKSLRHLFSDSFIDRELHRCFYYYACHPEKKPRNVRHWALALMRWLDNAYAKRASDIESKQQSFAV